MQGELSALRKEFQASQRTTTVEQREKLLTHAEAAAYEPLSEAQVRDQLDAMLKQAGWSVQDAGVGTDLWAKQGVGGGGPAWSGLIG